MSAAVPFAGRWPAARACWRWEPIVPSRLCRAICASGRRICSRRSPKDAWRNPFGEAAPVTGAPRRGDCSGCFAGSIARAGVSAWRLRRSLACAREKPWRTALSRARDSASISSGFLQGGSGRCVGASRFRLDRARFVWFWSVRTRLRAVCPSALADSSVLFAACRARSEPVSRPKRAPSFRRGCAFRRSAARAVASDDETP